MSEAFSAYRDEVRSGAFPGPEHQYPIPAEELDALRSGLEWKGQAAPREKSA
jgi:hypothetical protein